MKPSKPDGSDDFNYLLGLVSRIREISGGFVEFMEPWCHIYSWFGLFERFLIKINDGVYSD